MIAFLSWYLVFLLLGWVAFPLAFRFMPSLPQRGYALSKALGLLVWAFLFWGLASLHILQNDGGGVLLSVFIFVLIGALAGRGKFREMLAWVRENSRLVITSEALFLILFAFWTVVRAAAPEAAGTEKPMELAFINAILHSPQFPPHDPWLSGYAISYYYFGYVMVALLSRLTGVAGEVGFNLALAAWFGLAASASYAILYDLLALRVKQSSPRSRKAVYWALLAPLFVLFFSNADGLLEVLHARGVFWRETATGEWSSGFWSWLDIQELKDPPSGPLSFTPNRPGGIWWWRASRVLTDYDLTGAPREIIDEFPAFSFVLGDLHPHVLAMPFGLLVVGLALNLYLRSQRLKEPLVPASAWIMRLDFWLAVLALGSLAFLNTWDFPIYIALYAAAFLTARIQGSGWGWARIREGLYLVGLLSIFGVIVYAPFYAGFASQAGGILPSLSFFTRGAHFWVMFATLLVPILLWLVAELPGQDRRRWLRRGLAWSAIVLFGLWLLSYLLGWVYILMPQMAATLSGIQGGVSSFMALLGSLARRLAMPGMWLSMLGMMTLALATFLHNAGFYRNPHEAGSTPIGDGDAIETHSSRIFALLLFLVGAGLVLLPEFFYLRDQFGWRMNTIFKFYFQAWILWGIVAGYATVVLLLKVESWKRQALKAFSYAAFICFVFIGILYVYFGVMTRTQAFRPQEWTLNGAAHIERYQPDDYQAILWLREAGPGVVAEAVGGSYSDYARVATLSGKPNVLGWPGHESQWRGGAEEMGTREMDLELLYTVPDWETAQVIIDRYKIRYVYVGMMEQGSYRVREEKFQFNMALVYQNESVRIYEALFDQNERVNQ